MIKSSRFPGIKYLLQFSCLIWFALSLHLSPAAAKQSNADTTKYATVEKRKGDRCIVCDVSYEYIAQVILYKGRRVPVCAKHPKIFLHDPEPFFTDLQPKGALFQEEAVLEKTMKGGWFGLGIWVFFALVSAGLSANIALRKGLSSLKWFFIGLAASVFGLAWLLFKPATVKVELPSHFAKIPTTSSPVHCPKCGKENHPTAEACGECGKDLEPTSISEVKKLGL